MNHIPKLTGWETYPENLSLQGCNAYGYEHEAYNEQLTSDSKRLFATGERVCLKIIELGSSGKSHFQVYRFKLTVCLPRQTL